MSESLLTAKLVEAAGKRNGKSKGSDDSIVAARAFLAAVKADDAEALSRALRDFVDIASPSVDDEDDAGEAD
jgi:hypothetical protein